MIGIRDMFPDEKVKERMIKIGKLLEQSRYLGNFSFLFELR